MIGQRIESRLGRALAAWLPRTTLQALAASLSERDPELLLKSLGPQLNRKRNLENMPFDLPVRQGLQFEHLSGLFSSTSLDHAVIAMPIRQTAYLFGLIRQMQPQKVLEIGRYKGGSTLTIAAAMAGTGQFWSIDSCERELRVHGDGRPTTFDEQLNGLCQRFGLRVTLIVADSRTVALDTGELDLVLIDGDHSYEGVKSDFERFGRRVRRGGAVLFDDARHEGLFPTHSATVGRFVDEVLAQGEYRLVKTVNRLAHLERI